ncbi:MAG: efflux RND transporter periplasmic adaptor subunit [Candidatus Omnitrophica bacterium]|nr:efflux RND transporter periplasmic adaptor subunit [Candidatus Omnitrophota bacterium]
MSEQEIAELEKGGVQDKNLILPPNESSPHLNPPPAEEGGGKEGGRYVWVYGAIYEYELPFVKVGSSIKVKVPTFPDQEFSGAINALDPVLDPTTRSIRIRARVENPGGLLKPGMYVDVYLRGGEEDVLAIPLDAVMHTGERELAFVAKGEGYFEPREIRLGTQAGDYWVVKEGLKMGEQIVVSGNFLIDSESRLQAALQGMTGGGHQHGQ